MAELGSHQDERGLIEDLLSGPIDCVTRISTRKNAVRGNHVHAATTQWAYIISGRLLVITEKDGFRQRRVYDPGEIAEELPGTAHAWRALEDTVCLVFTRGPRSGASYEDDVERLTEKAKLIR